MNAASPRFPGNEPAAGFRRRPIWPGVAALAGDKRGIIAVMFALMLPLMLGFIGLGVETALWYKSHRDLQSAADAAAIAATYEVKSASDAATRRAASLREAERHVFDESSSSDSFDINMPPTTGSYQGDANAVEIQLTKTVALMFSNWFLDSDVSLDTRAVATVTSSSEACVLALDTSSSSTLSSSGAATTTLTGCSLAVNSSHSSALTLTGGATFTADCASIVGGITGSDQLITTCANPQANALPVSDPYESVDEPTSTGCDHTNYSANNETLSPGTYCKGINFSGSVTLNSGVYFIDAGTFKINSGATVTSASGGVTIFLTKQDSGPKYADVSINGGATVDMSAQTSGDYAGLLFYQDDDTPLSPPSTHTINGGASIDLTGALYFPNGNVNYTGGAETGSGSCMQIVAQTVSFSSDAKMNINCSGSGMSSLEVLDTVGLVE